MTTSIPVNVGVYLGDALAQYHFGAAHPFGPRRHEAFARAMTQQNLLQHVSVLSPTSAQRNQVELFHVPEYIDMVEELSQRGYGFLDAGDTPVVPQIYQHALMVVGSTLDGVQRIMAQEFARVFIPIAGLHHARRGGAAGFCVFNDCGIAIEFLRQQYGVRRIAYVDIDAHHGDGVFYGFEDDPDVCFVDLHEDGRYLYPGTGTADETGRGKAIGSKLNIPMSPNSTDQEFFAQWERAEQFIEQARPDFILLQCGADSIKNDPITHLQYSPQAHYHATLQLCRLADRLGHGRMLAMGGGGYNLDNIAQAWTAVVQAMLDSKNQEC